MRNNRYAQAFLPMLHEALQAPPVVAGGGSLNKRWFFLSGGMLDPRGEF